jgi:hypothetical protein
MALFLTLWSGTGLFLDLLFLLALHLVLTGHAGPAVRTRYPQVSGAAVNRYKIFQMCFAGVVFPPLMLISLTVLAAWVNAEHAGEREPGARK